MAYSLTTLAAARAALRLQLQDPSATNPYWTDTELNAAIVESLRTWQALTGWNRDRGTLTTVGGTGFYDLAATGGAFSPAGMFDYNVTDVAIYQAITAILLEPTALPYAGTDQFSQAQISNAISDARDQFLLDTGSVITRTLLSNGAQPISRLAIPQTIIDVRRAAWFTTTTNLFSTLWRFDEFAADSFSNSWQNAQQTPNGFSPAVTPPITLQIIPPSNDPGTTSTEILSVSTGATLPLNPASPVPLGIPDDFSYGVKYLALASLLEADGQDRDMQRAQYCEQRYTEAVTAARLNPSVLQGYNGTSVLFAGSVFEEDAFNNNWQNQTQGPPQRLVMAGRNLIATVPYPDIAYSITIDLVRNMPFPTADGNFLQIGNEKLEMILNYAQHIASFKMGGAEFQSTMPYFKDFLKAAVLDNSRLNANAPLRRLLDQPAQKHERMYPRIVPSPQPLDATQVEA